MILLKRPGNCNQPIAATHPYRSRALLHNSTIEIIINSYCRMMCVVANMSEQCCESNEQNRYDVALLLTLVIPKF